MISLSDVTYVPTWEASEVLIWTNPPVEPPEGVMLEDVWLYWRKYENELASGSRYSRYAENQMCAQNMRKRGTCSTSSPEGDVPGARKDSFIHIAKLGLSLSERSGGQSESRGLECCQDQCTPLHDTNGNQKWGEERERRGRGWDRDPKGEPVPRNDLSLYCIAIDSYRIHSRISRKRFAWRVL